MLSKPGGPARHREQSQRGGRLRRTRDRWLSLPFAWSGRDETAPGLSPSAPEPHPTSHRTPGAGKSTFHNEHVPFVQSPAHSSGVQLSTPRAIPACNIPLLFTLARPFTPSDTTGCLTLAQMQCRAKLEAEVHNFDMQHDDSIPHATLARSDTCRTYLRQNMTSEAIQDGHDGQ